jgi:phasin family protein
MLQGTKRGKPIMHTLSEVTTMFDQFYSKNAALPFESLLASSKGFSRLSLDAAEKLTAFQLEQARAYTEFGLAELRAALEVKDAKGLQDYIAGRSKVAEKLGKKLQDDAKVLADLSANYSSEAQKLVSEQLAGLNGAAKKAA